uniref:RRM domain-containing protein n=1 Tax=Meloidogyne incognita TaxID=6306 RepID=A0A914L4U7_MELIC
MSSVAKNHRGPGLKGWRILVRNLKFETKEEDIRKLAGKFGEILEINLPKGRDKRFPNSCAGFCFIQFKRRVDAEAAKKELNFIKFNGRKISLDWTMNKDDWENSQHEENSKDAKEIKDEPVDVEMNSGTEEEMTTNGTTKKDLKSETDDDDYDTCHSEESEDEEDDDIEGDDFEDEEDEENGTEDEDDEISNELEPKESKFVKTEKNGKKQNFKKDENRKNNNNPRQGDVALSEGRVVFLRNLPLSLTDEGLKEWLIENKIAPFSLAILCRSKQTKYPTGAAFVHLVEKSTTDLFLEKLESPQGMLFEGRRLIGYRAVDKKSADSFKRPQEEDKNPKDKRNLYLLRASLIRKGTPQEKGMSEDDAKLRERLGQFAKKKLQNMITFVSPTRLAIHNIPFKFTDEQLRHLCRAAAGVCDNSIMECRIMRQVKGEDNKGKVILGKSNGYGFVAFKEHSAALQCLKQMNNNPHMFTNERRPIVEFSIENLNALRLKERRKQMSRGEIVAASVNNNKQNKKKDINKSEENFKTGNDPSALEKTKKEFMKGGQKFLPKKFGEKKRHKDMQQQNKRRKRSDKDDNQKCKRNKRSSK